MGHLNINSIQNKFDALSLTVKNNVDILMISETKLDYSFPTAQFLLHCFSAPYNLTGTQKIVESFCILGRIYHLGFVIVNVKLVLKLFQFLNYLKKKEMVFKLF